MTPPVDGADFLAALVASCFLGALPPVDFLAVCLVRAMSEMEVKFWAKMESFGYNGENGTERVGELGSRKLDRERGGEGRSSRKLSGFQG